MGAVGVGTRAEMRVIWHAGLTQFSSDFCNR